jgi:hypothetical protein
VQPKYTKTDLHLTVDLPDDGGSKQTLSGATVVKLFRLMRDKDFRLVGLDVQHARPNWLYVPLYGSGGSTIGVQVLPYMYVRRWWLAVVRRVRKMT